MSCIDTQIKSCQGTCGLDLPIERFYPHPKGGHGPLCRTCTVADNKLKRQDPEGHRRALAERKRKKAAAKAALVAAITEKTCTKCAVVKPLVGFREHRGLYGRSSWCLECERVEGKKYADEHRDEINAKKRVVWGNTEFTDEQRGEAARRASAWYANNPEQAKASMRAWLEENRAVYNVIQQRRRAKKAAVLNTLTSDEWQETLEFFGHACAYCLRTDLPLTLDHMNPISKGGDHTVENVVPACKPCNSKKHARLIFVMLNQKTPVQIVGV